MSCKASTLKLYKHLLRESSKLQNYNFREYALGKVKFEFRSNKSEQDPDKLQQQINKAKYNLEVVRRQV
jgi:hypothetical protein